MRALVERNRQVTETVVNVLIQVAGDKFVDIEGP